MVKLVAWGSITQAAADFLKKLVSSGYTILVGGGTLHRQDHVFKCFVSLYSQRREDCDHRGQCGAAASGTGQCCAAGGEGSQSGRGPGDYHTGFASDSSEDASVADYYREVRSGEAGDFLSCLNTGHSGSLGSAHANSVRDMIGRLENMVLMGMNIPIPVIRRQIVSGIEILVHLGRDGNGKKTGRGNCGNNRTEG